jgi:hypothetical protein
MVSFAQAAANPELIQSSNVIELYDKQGKCTTLKSTKGINGKETTEDKTKNYSLEEYYRRMIEFIVQAGPHHSFMYVNNNNIDLPLVSPIFPHLNLECPTEKYIWNFKRQSIKACSIELANVDKMLLLYGVKVIRERIEAVLVEHGACLDLRPLLGDKLEESMEEYGKNPAVIYGSSEISINRCIIALLNCLSQIIILEIDPAFFSAVNNEEAGDNIKCGFLRVQNKVYILEDRFFGRGKFSSTNWKKNMQFIKAIRKIQPQDSKELLCGKKDGKINRIQRESGVEISLIDHEESKWEGYYWIVAKPSMDIMNFNGLNQAFEEMEKEFPAELTFHLEEFHHKRLIGAGGSTIQKVMKQYGVYVRFLGFAESLSVLGKEQVQFPGAPVDNVIIRTPQRNQFALDQMKRHLFNMVGNDEPISLKTTPIDKYSNFNVIQDREPNSLYWVFREADQLFLKQIRKSNKVYKTNLGKEPMESSPKLETPETKQVEYNFATEFESILEEIPRDLGLIGNGNIEASQKYTDKATDPMMDELKPIMSRFEKNETSYIPFNWLLEDPLVHFRPRSQSFFDPNSPECNREEEDIPVRRPTI